MIAKIGSGGMGVVYKAEDTRLRCDVALKFLIEQTPTGDEVRTRLLNEARGRRHAESPQYLHRSRDR